MARKLTIKEFIKRSNKTHNNKYDYSLVEYKNTKTKVKIICPVHGVFEQKPYGHMKKYGCPKCGYIKVSNSRKKSQEQFIEKAKKVHGDKYDYSLVEYMGCYDKVKIICNNHKEPYIFEQISYAHLQGQGCPKCTKTTTTEQFIEKAKEIHNNKYDYSLVDYKNSSIKVKIICPVHGTFEQKSSYHLNGQGCPKCFGNISQQETELQEWLKEYIDIETNNRSVIAPYELDIIIPSKKLCIEYNGLYWHSEQRGKDRKYHLNKYNLCKEKGYRLIQIWENEWLFKRDIVKSIILNAIGINKRIIHGRKCIIQDVSPKDARTMYNENHIQGFKGGKHKGLYYNDELISLMTIDTRNELQRFVNKKYTKVHGAFSKLLKAFLRENKNLHNNLYTFADLRYFTGNVYKSNGFVYQYTTKPNYFYFKGHDTINIYSRVKFQKHKLKNELNHFDCNKTEYQNMIVNGYDRIWDSGNLKYLLK